MGKVGIFFVCVVAVLLIATYSLYGQLFPTSIVYPRGEATIYLDNVPIKVTVVDTPETRSKGLSGRESLRRGEGMFFIFPEDGKYSFWMKDMQFPIDILWISAEGVVVGADINVDPTSYPKTFSPPVPIRFVLEVPAGFVASQRVTTSSKVSF